MNKQICIIILLLTCRCVVINAQTNVSGFISTNTTWNLAGSPYIVIGNTLVSQGFTLTIEPGVIVKFNTDKALQIDGELIAIGTAQNRITFTSNKVSPAAGDWAKIHFSDASVDAVFDTTGNYVAGSIMKFCDILYGGGLGFGAIHSLYSSQYFSNCRIMYSSIRGIYYEGFSFVMDSSSIKNCSDYGLYLARVECNLSIKNNFIENNRGGIFIQCPSSNTCLQEISNNYFNLNYDQNTLLLLSTYNLIISDNYFVNNNGIDNSILELNNSSPHIHYETIDCNKFLYNQSSNGSIFLATNHLIGSMSNNVFNGNIVSTANSIVDLSEPSSFYFRNNLLINNSSTLAPCFKCTLSSGLALDHNEFSNNTGTSALHILSNPNSYGFKYNNLSNPNCQYELYNDTPYGQPNITADSNYWGSTSIQHIDSVIYDFFDFANQSVVYYSPILVSPAVVDTTCPVIPTLISNIDPSLFTFNLFPNPVTTHFTIVFNKIIHKGSIEIYNTLGDNVLQENIHYASQKEISLLTISNGIYLVRLFDGQRYYSKKIIVEHD
ncbi:MAG: T9SS type A sorting domain-containing protein [Bacteroidetes bacterium]|nr:T9SS type A sorting domain-containing protein [Chitinophagales bacterium]MCO5287989.1 T9SS type A sorting domain-containing protein [Bacteroidota bacterium]MCW5930220.1 T9SS type A sorting domain-containing protein [Bacteroidota bacterium]